MRATLDHIGVAVKDLDAALAFYRDALGLEIEPAEEVASERVRAHFIPVGEAALELLEATSSDSAIARYIDKRGPGIHHITLRVDDIAEALRRLRTKGVRLVDETPRPGAEGALVAFVHPSAAHGVLVELKQASAAASPQLPTEPPRFHTPSRVRIGDLELITLSDGFFRLDAGSMFGVLPKAVWQRRVATDSLNRMTLGLRPLIVRGQQTLLIDAGCGDKLDAKSAGMYGLERDYNLSTALAQAGIGADDVDIVLASHLHWDHAGGFTARDDGGRVVPRFPRARYMAHRGEWDDATHPHERNRAVYPPENFVPLAEAGVLSLVDDDAEVMPGVRLRRSGGHTSHHQVIQIQSKGDTAVFASDMYPTSAHVPEASIMAYDLYPMDTLAFKRAFGREAIEREYLVYFGHDPGMAAGRLRRVEGKITVERAI